MTSIKLTAQWRLISYVQNYSYTGTTQTVTAPETGYYKVELWGAQGNDANRNRSYGGKGAYVKGDIFIAKNTSLYVYVGQHKSEALSSSYNSGSTGGTGTDSANGGSVSGYGGGGATDIRVTFGDWNNANSLRSRIIVAAGGGGATDYAYPVNGGYGGALIGGAGYNGKFPTQGCVHTPPQGATQVGPGANAILGCAATHTNGSLGYQGQFGIGGNGNPTWSSGGGGGWYGGTGGGVTNCSVDSGSGGSSYVSGYTGAVAVTSTSSSSPKSGCTTGTTNNACSISPYINPATNIGYTFTSIQIIAGNASMPNTAGTGNETGHSGNGYAKITWLGDTI